MDYCRELVALVAKFRCETKEVIPTTGAGELESVCRAYMAVLAKLDADYCANILEAKPIEPLEPSSNDRKRRARSRSPAKKNDDVIVKRW